MCKKKNIIPFVKDFNLFLLIFLESTNPSQSTFTLLWVPKGKWRAGHCTHGRFSCAVPGRVSASPLGGVLVDASGKNEGGEKDGEMGREISSERLQ